MLAMRESSVIRDKERSREFMNRQKLLFERFNQRKSSEFERMKETFNIDSIDIPEQTVDISEQAVDIAMQQEHVQQMKQSIRRGRGRPSGRKRGRRGDNRDGGNRDVDNRGVDNRIARRDARKDARRGAEKDAERDAAADDTSDVHMKDV